MYFNRILIANRGEIAARIIRACRALEIGAVAVFSEADRGALHVRLADDAVPIGPAPAAESYLRVDAIVDAALRAGCEAVHPGYGFLSERAELARACAAAGLVFIGPRAETIELMGSKIEAKRLAERAGVPTVPGYLGEDQRPESLREQAAVLGFPLLIKASAGGGGKGMRVVRALEEFNAALEGAGREARAAFGDDTVMLERLIERPRHIEIQVLADQHGHVVHLFERECSIQRRHQKIVEEAPSPALSPAARDQIGAAALRLAREAAYVNAGTVEFVLDPSGEFFFLEMNTRLQVEHPVTELTTGQDLVQLQIAIASGAPLPFSQEELGQRGHAIEARIYAEDPATMLPSTGRVLLFAPPAGEGVRNDAGIASGDEVSVFYDPMVAKLIVYGANRAVAIGRLQRALADYAVLGVETNIPLLQAIAAHPLFEQGQTKTDFLEQAGLAQGSSRPQGAPAEVLAAAALAMAPDVPQAGQARDPWASGAWRPLGERTLLLREGQRDLLVSMMPEGQGWRATLGPEQLDIEQPSVAPDELTLAIRAAGTQRQERFRFARDGDALLIAWRGASYRVERTPALSVDMLAPRGGAHAGHASLAAPMPGTVIRVLVEAGQQVEANQPLVVLEAMKMEHVVAAPYGGTVERVACAPGAVVTRGAVLVEIEAG
jgi:3-methylcrotonyl-CoA carboxylase alpha subunit